MYALNLDDKNSKRTQWVSLLTEIQLHSLNLLELHIFHKKYYRQSEINQLFTIYLEYKIMNLSCVDFNASLSQNIWLQEKPCKITLIYFLQMTIKRMTKNI